MDNKEISKKLNLDHHEVPFNVIPIGIKYICDHCHNGDMVPISDDFTTVFPINGKLQIKHYCKNCGSQKVLPKIYPYIEWIATGEPIIDEVKENETT